jgi:BTB/POZ domain
MTSNSEIVRLNVGGTRYEVSRSLIAMYPDTMLARLISEKWEGKDSTKEIFIERDGLRFRCVLDYMRDKIAHLPMTVSKPSVVQDLAFYGFENIPPHAIDASISNIAAATHLVTCAKNQETKIKEQVTTLYYEIFAYQCFKEYSTTGKQNLCMMSFPDAPEVPAWNQTLCERCLAEYGLKLITSYCNGYQYANNHVAFDPMEIQ